MSLIVYTAQYRYAGPDWLDITVKGNDPLGRYFAPTWEMVTQYKRDMDQDAYTQAYVQLMRRSYQTNRAAWENVLAQNRLVLVCFCPPEAFCHRIVLARLLSACGAQLGGEIAV